MTTSGPLSGRVAIVTGSARNIGRAIALALARDGADIMVHARSDAEGVAETVASVRGLGRQAGSCLADLSSEDGARTLIGATLGQLGRIDIVVNNAAIRRNTPFIETTLAMWHEVMANSLDCAFLVSRHALPHMLPGKWGRIVNLTGISLHKGTPGRTHVSAAKAGMIGMSRSLAMELATSGVTVNCVSPGAIDTVRGKAAGARSAAGGGSSPMGRDGSPEEIAHVIAMLCHPAAAFTTGQVIQVNGGAALGGV